MLTAQPYMYVLSTLHLYLRGKIGATGGYILQCSREPIPIGIWGPLQGREGFGASRVVFAMRFQTL